MNTDEQRIAVLGLFSKETNDQIQDLRVQISETFGVYDALNWPPHLTLRTGFLVSLEKIPEFVNEFKVFMSSFDPIRVVLDGFKFFDNSSQIGATIKSPYVAVIDVKNKTELREINKKLMRFEPYSSGSTFFNPHVTLAYNDLNKKQFQEIKAYLSDKDFVKDCLIDTIALYINTGLGKSRKIIAEIKLN